MDAKAMSTVMLNKSLRPYITWLLNNEAYETKGLLVKAMLKDTIRSS